MDEFDEAMDTKGKKVYYNGKLVKGKQDENK